jgi:hypothetical protein
MPRGFGDLVAGRHTAQFVMIVGVAISIAGCAGSSQARLSSKELARKGDATCENLRRALNAADIQAGGVSVPDRAKLSALFATAEERASNQLAKLEPEERSAEREWQQVIAKRRALIPYHHRMIKYASRGEVDKLEATYNAYKVAQWQMQLAFKHSRFGFKICWDIG